MKKRLLTEAKADLNSDTKRLRDAIKESRMFGPTTWQEIDRRVEMSRRIQEMINADQPVQDCIGRSGPYMNPID